MGMFKRPRPPSSIFLYKVSSLGFSRRSMYIKDLAEAVARFVSMTLGSMTLHADGVTVDTVGPEVKGQKTSSLPGSDDLFYSIL